MGDRDDYSDCHFFVYSVYGDLLHSRNRSILLKKIKAMKALWRFITSPIRYIKSVMSSTDAASCMRFCMVMVCATLCYCMVKAVAMRFDSGSFWGSVAGIFATVFAAKGYQKWCEIKPNQPPPQ